MILRITLIGLMAGVLGTGLGGVLSGIFKKKVDKYIDFFMGLSGGIMLAVVVFDLMKEAIEQKGIFVTVSATFLGVVITMLIKENLHMSQDKQAGYLIFISILLHNLPEGLAIGSSFVSAETLGFTLAIVLFAGIRERLEIADIPEAFRGFPITLIAAGLMSIAFLGFTGLIKL